MQPAKKLTVWRAKRPSTLCIGAMDISLVCTRKMSIVRDNGVCLNCLRPGHFAKQCCSVQKCNKCQKHHHFWWHVNMQDKEAKLSNAASPCKENLGVLATHTSQSSSSHQVLLMTCQVRLTSPDGHTTKVRALLDSASSASFITEHSAQHLHLWRRHHGMKISGIGGATTQSPSWGMVDFKVTSLGCEGKNLEVEALVLPKIPSVLPSHCKQMEASYGYLFGWSGLRYSRGHRRTSRSQLL